jgi:hypothetical protein
MTAPEANKSTGGRPSDFKPEFTAEVERLCKLGMVDSDLAMYFGKSRSTISNWKRAHPEFFEALSRGKHKADLEVAAELHKNAAGYEYHEEHAFKLKRTTEYPDGRKVTEEYVEIVKLLRWHPGDVTAQIFWLKNRRPDLWRDVKKIDSEQKVDISVRGREALEELKRDGFVLLEGEYNIVGLLPEGKDGQPIQPSDTEDTLQRIIEE